MKFGTKTIALAAAALSTLAIAGCSVSSDSSGSSGGGSDAVFSNPNVDLIGSRQKVFNAMKGKRIAFVPLLYKGYTLTENWGTTMERTFTEMGAEFKVYDANFSPDRMVSTLNDLIARKAADVLVLQNQAQGLLDNAIEQAKKAGIYTVVLNMQTTKLGDAFAGVDVYGSASAIADRAMTDCDGRSADKKLVVIDGTGNDPASVLWDQGIKDAAAKKGYTVTVSHSNYQNPAAQSSAESAIAQNQGKMCGFLVMYDVNAITVGQTVKTAQSRGSVAPGSIGTYTLDANYTTCDAIRAGTITATSAYDVQGVGAAGAVAVQNLILGGVKPGAAHNFGYVSNTVVDKSNVDTTSIACYHSK